MKERTMSLRPVSGTQSRTSDLVRMLSEDIRSGRIKPGEKLPTEQEIVRMSGVSRTVVREAVAALRAEGLVVTRQGVGAFVTAVPGQGMFRISTDEANTTERLLQIMELRMGLEVEAAGIAANRADQAAIDQISAIQDKFLDGARRGELVIGADYGFHRSVCEATGNGFFPRILNSLGQILIPRQSMASTIPTVEERTAYLTKIAAEHGEILDFIRKKDEAGARRSMRHHLAMSADRYRSLHSIFDSH